MVPVSLNAAASSMYFVLHATLPDRRRGGEQVGPVGDRRRDAAVL
jgi:hypothetical protein